MIRFELWDKIPPSLYQWDLELFKVVNALIDEKTPFWAAVKKFSEGAGGGILYLFLLGFPVFYMSQKNGKGFFKSPIKWTPKFCGKFFLYILWIAVLWGICDFLTSEWKEAFGRIKPFKAHVVPKPSGPLSFPSGHASSSFALLVIFFLLFKDRLLSEQKWLYFVWGFLWASSIALSRVLFGWHYPLDIMVGAIWGTFYAWAALNISKKVAFFV